MKIAVRGSHRTWIDPERGRLLCSAQAEGASRDKVVREATLVANALEAEVKTLVGQGVESYTLDPVRVSTWQPTDADGVPLPERTRAAADLGVDFSDFEKLSEFAAFAAGMAGASVGWVEWRLTDETARRTEEDALAEAVDDARRRAQAIADAEGAGDVVVEEVSDLGLNEPIMARAMMAKGYAGDASTEAVQVVPEKQLIETTLEVRFTTAGKASQPRRSRA